jgi:hypothetical protein
MMHVNFVVWHIYTHHVQVSLHERVAEDRNNKVAVLMQNLEEKCKQVSAISVYIFVVLGLIHVLLHQTSNKP